MQPLKSQQMYPPNKIINFQSSPSDSNSPRSSLSSTLSNSVHVILDTSPYDFNSRNHSPSTLTHNLSPSSTMQNGGLVLSNIDVYDGGEHLPHEHISTLYQPEPMVDTDDDNERYTLALSDRIVDGRLPLDGSSAQLDCSSGGYDPSPSADGVTNGGDERLQYAESVVFPADWHNHRVRHNNQNHQAHLVDTIILRQDNPAFLRGPMLASAASSLISDPVATATDALISPSPSNLPPNSPPLSRHLPSLVQSPNQMNPPDFIPQPRNHRKTSISGHVHSGNVFESVLSPMVEGTCHSHQPYWYNVAGSDVQFESLLPSPISGLFPFAANSTQYDQPHIPFFASPHSSLVNSPTSPTSGFSYFPAPSQTQSHLQQPVQFQQSQDRPAVGHFVHQYFNRAQIHPYSNLTTMPQNLAGFGAGQSPQKSPKKGGRRPKEEQSHLPPEEEMKRSQRRARNKEAAARCRKRRLDHMNTLSDQVAKLQDFQTMLIQECEQLKKEKEELEYVLQAHEPACLLRNKPIAALKKSNSAQVPGIKAIPTPQPFVPFIKPESVSVSIDCDDDKTGIRVSEDPPLSSATPAKQAKFSSTFGSGTTAGVNRPDTLHFRTGDLDSPGFPIETPSKIFSHDPMNGLNLPTGLTPVTSGLTPILSLANAAATLETPTTSVFASLETAGTKTATSGITQKSLQSL